MRFSRGESHFLLAAFLAAFLMGAFGGLLAWQDVTDGYFHGGVLPEDASAATSNAIWAAVGGFAGVSILGMIAFVILPLMCWRFFLRKDNDA